MIKPLRSRRLLYIVAVCCVIMIMIIPTLHLLSQEQQMISDEQIPYRPSNSDYERLIDLKNFNFIIDHKTCRTANGSQPLIVILVFSAPGNFLRREAIRNTWGRKDHRSLLIFLFGAVTNKRLNDQLAEENELHGDIVQGNFIDSYRNLTYKHVMGLKWFKYTCKYPNFILRIDDDVMVNSQFLHESLEMFYSKNQTIIDIQKQSSFKLRASQLIFGHTARNLNVQRKNSKWTVLYEEYSEKMYPPYCLGYVILYSADVVKRLYEQAQITRYFWLEDVFSTGILRQKLNISLTDGSDVFLTLKQTNDILANKTDEVKKLKHKFLFSRSELSHSKIRKLWSCLMNEK